MCEAFGCALADARKARGMSQIELANALGMSQTMISTWERGRGVPDTSDAFALESALQLPPGGLSHHLGFVPAGTSSPPSTVDAAIAADPLLDVADKRALHALYRELARRYNGRNR
jgi:transcriptional regulator with XRE-family HTH domain